MSKFRDYPAPVKTRGGCKVSWAYYATKGEACECAAAAWHNARILEREGYDFGYMTPGEIRSVDGLYEVCLP